jgi:hypothetical protein
MAARAGAVAEVPRQWRLFTEARCPHLVFRNVLGAERVSALLDYVASRRSDFTPSGVVPRTTGVPVVSHHYGTSLHLRDLGAFAAPFEGFVRSISPFAIDALRLVEGHVEPREFDLAVYHEGGRFRAHGDAFVKAGGVRVAACIYYFAATPRRFTGGGLRLYGFPKLFGGDPSASPPFVDVASETDSLVVIPSWLRHDVLPVRVGSGAWIDGRFTITCFIHRVSPPVEGSQP